MISSDDQTTVEEISASVTLFILCQILINIMSCVCRAVENLYAVIYFIRNVFELFVFFSHALLFLSDFIKHDKNKTFQ